MSVKLVIVANASHSFGNRSLIGVQRALINGLPKRACCSGKVTCNNCLKGSDLMRIVPLILSGGSGTRLWPVSRSLHPKQFLNLGGEGEPSLLGATLRRLPEAADVAPPVVLSNNDHRFLVAHAASDVGIEPDQIFLEPVGRNTAPAIAVGAFHAIKSDPDAILAVMPSDHMIANEDGFREAVAKAAEIAAAGHLVLLGVVPREANTGYGYIRRGEAIGEYGGAAYKVDGFTEKPQAEVAEEYLRAGGYYWNSGIFILHAQTFLDELERLEPEIFAAAKASLENATPDLAFVRLDEETFAASPSKSVDYAVMEKTSKAVVLPLDVGWSDVGSWSSLAALGEQDEDGNVLAGLASKPGEALLEGTTNSYVYSTRSLVATIGLDNVVIVETPDALLVSDKSRSQDVGRIVARLRAGESSLHEQHLRNHRPWGFFEQLNLGDRFQVKLLHVKPGAELSKQRHHHRSEHWVVVRGTALVRIGETEQFVQENESVYIVATQWHQLANPGKVPLEIIEVQIGPYLGEDDIERESDIYNRQPHETK